MTDCSCSCVTPTYGICHSGCCCQTSCELDCILSNLKAELFEKQNNAKDFCALQSRFIQLQNDIKALTQEKNCLECQLNLVGEEGSKKICDLRTENECLKNELNEKNSMNKKLYGDNNNLFQVLEGETNDNHNLKDQVCHQENILQRLNQDKLNLENTVQSLNQLRDKHMADIQNLNTQISLLNKDSNALDNTLKTKNCHNMKIISEFNCEKNINNDLINELKSKECALRQIEKELCMANETKTRLEKDLSYLNYSHNKNNEQICSMNKSLAKECALRKNIECENDKLNCAINVQNSNIQKITNDNNILNNINTNINSDNDCLNEKIEAYKKHILILTNQNEKLQAELEAIISRDSKLLFTLGRDSHLIAIQNENKNAINSSLDCLQAFSQNKGRINNPNNFSKTNYNNFGKNINSYGMDMNMNKTMSYKFPKNDIRNNINEDVPYYGREERQSSGEENP